ncbi:MAG TPA: DUF305 domain-containing protein [Rubrobacter sp.]|nr:DUF305 domain-containing protein [Rubrobacter sp.]
MGSSRPGRPWLPSLRVGEVLSALGPGRLFVTLVAVALLFCHGVFGYTHQLPAIDVRAAHAAHAAGVHQPGQDQTTDGLHVQGTYFATLLLLLFATALLLGGGMPADPRSLADEEPFDRAFIEAMIPHHRSAIQMAGVALGESDNPQIEKLAGEIVEAQEREISQMQTWRENWYPEG